MTIWRGWWFACGLAGAAVASCLNPLPEDFPSHDDRAEEADLGAPAQGEAPADSLTPVPGAGAGAPGNSAGTDGAGSDGDEAPASEIDRPGDAGAGADAGVTESIP